MLQDMLMVVLPPSQTALRPQGLLNVYLSSQQASVRGLAGTPEGQKLLVERCRLLPAAPVGQRCKGAGGAWWGVALVLSY